MSYITMCCLFVILILIVLGSGMHVSTGLALIGIIGFKYFIGMEKIIGTIVYNSAASFTLAAIPLFIFMGEIIKRTGISKSLYRGVSKWVSPIPGGLLHSNILSCAFFAAISGSSVATAAAIGSIAFPEQRKRKYPIKMIAGSLSAGGTIGILIPPSSTMIVYGAMTGESVGKLFIAGIIPGIIMTVVFMVYICIVSIINKDKLPIREKVSIKKYLMNFLIGWKDIWPVALLIASIFIGIYGGFMTATEAGAISVGEAMIIALLFKRLNFKVLKESALATIKVTNMIIFIIIGASLLGNFISMIKLPAMLCTAIANAGIGRYGVLCGIIVIYIILGCLLEATAVICLTLPIVYPLLVTNLGFNSLWVGILVVILNQIALITPPVGLNVYVIHGISGIKDIGEIFSGILPYFILMCCIIIFIIFFPGVVTFLPGLMVTR